MKKFPKELKFFFAVFFVWTLFFSVSSSVLALENSFDYVSGINYEPIAKLVNFLNDKKSELEKLGDSFGKTNTVKRQISNIANQNNARKSFLLSAVLNTAKDAVVGKPKQYFGKVFCIAKDFVFPGSCDDNTNQDYTSITASKKNNEEEIDALKNQYDDAIISANELNKKFNLLQQELGKVKAGGVIIKEPIIEQKTVERTIEKIVSGLSQDDLSASIASIKTELNNLNTNLTNQINNLSFNTSRQSTAAFQAISLTNKIDSLSGTRLSGIIVNGVSGLTNADIPDDITASNYLPLTGGTLSGDLTINGNATLGVITLQNATAGYFTATSTTQASTFPYASTTALTVSGDSWFGGLSTITNLLLAGSTTLQNFTANNSTTTNATTTNLAISGSAYIGSLNGPLQANNGLVSATTSVGYQYGGTGLTGTPSFGQILRGTGTGYSLVATSTLGINTNDITEGTNLFWTNDRFDNRLSATTTLLNLTTLANLSITGSQVSNLNTLWDNRMSATTSLQNLTTLANLATIGTIASGIWNGSSIGNAYVDDDITLTNITQITNRAISDTTGTLTVARGGTGQTSFGQGWLNSDGTTLSASTSPTVNYLTATSTTATSTFAGGLFVAGHCVTGDTRLRRRRKKKNGEGYDYDEVEIKDIQVGDEIASLDEETGKIVWSKVNALMDMGVKKIYKLTTASGKTIRTTAEHPYFIKNNKISSKKAIAFIDYANIKAWARNKKLAIDMKALKEILSAVGVNDAMFYYGVDIKNEKMAGFIDVLKKIGYQTITKPLQYFRVALIDILNQSANINWMETLEKSLKENLIKEAKTLDSKNHKLLVPKANFDVEITIDALKNISKFDTFLFFSGDGDFTPLIQKVNESGKNTAVIAGREFMSATLREMAKIHVKLEDVVKIVPQIVYSLSENGSYKKPTPAQDERVWENCVSNIADLLGLSNCSVDNLATSENGLWKKVVYLKEGMEIAINDVGNDKAVFDKIAKIEILPEEQVYDIEVEGTHNFIGNDIVAHNTYIGGTSSSTNLIVSNNSALGTIASGIWNGSSIGNAYIDDDITLTNLTQITNRAISDTTGTLSVARGGTGQTSFGQGWLNSDGTTLSASTSPTVNYITATSTTATSTLSTGGLTVGVNQFVVQQNSGNVGIGTTSPQSNLEVAASGSNPLIRVTRTDGSVQAYLQAVSTDVRLGAVSNHPLLFYQYNTERMRIDTSGNVGIGTTSPYAKLSVEGSSALGNSATAGYFTATSTAQASTFPYASTTALTVSGSAYIGSLNGPLQANNGLVSATTSVGYQYGGTGLTDTPSFGQMLRGTGTGYSLVATSTFGINTSDLTEGSNLFWTNDRFDNRLSATTTLPNLTTLLGLTNASTTGLTVTGQTTLATALTGLLKGASGVVSAITTSLGLAGEISDETGSGALVFGTSPVFTTQITTPSILSAGALGITPASGSNLNVNLAGTGDFAVNTNQLYVDTSTGNVGIGTTLPGNSLHIAKAKSGSGVESIRLLTLGLSGTAAIGDETGITFTPAGGTTETARISGISGPDNVVYGSLSFSTRNYYTDTLVEVMRMNNKGNVGIGTTTPLRKLHLSNSGTIIDMMFEDTDAVADSKLWTWGVVGDYFVGSLRNDANNSGNNWVQVSRSGNTPSIVSFPNGNVGIGTAAPNRGSLAGRILTVGGGTTGTDGAIELLGFSGSTDGLLGNIDSQNGNSGDGVASARISFLRANNGNDSGQIAFSTRSSTTDSLAEAMRISRQGNVGIGTTEPGAKLDLYRAGTGAVLRIGAPSTGTVNDASLDFYTNNGDNVPTYARVGLGVGGGTIGDEIGYLTLSTINHGSLTEKMRVAADGNVGIGTTSPASLLHVQKDQDGGTRIRVRNDTNGASADAGIELVNSAGIFGQILFGSPTRSFDGETLMASALSIITAGGGGPINIATRAAQPIRFYTGSAGLVASAERMRIDSSGNVGIGTTTPGAKLDVFAGNIDIDNTTNANQFGGITKNGARFIHNFNYGNNGVVTTTGNNTFIGLNTGNFTMGSTATLAYEAGDNNVIGTNGLSANTLGYGNNGIGSNIFQNNTSGIFNSGIGHRALESNTSGSYNTGIGMFSLTSNTTGSNNVAVGYLAGYNGAVALQTNTDSIFIGSNANSSVNGLTNVIAIGSIAQATQSNQVVLGNSSITQTLLRGNVGIGTTTPGAKLHALATTEQLRLGYDDDSFTQFTIDINGNLKIDPTGSTITIPDQNLKVCAGDACQTTALNSGNGNLTVENNIEIGGNYNRTCATGYVWVPGSSKFGTLPGFCAMKYEAKNDGSDNAVSTATGGPYVSIDQPTSRSKCEAVGLGYHLINEMEWMTIAENIAQTPINDMDDDAGLQLATGHSDNAPASALAATSASDPVVSGCNLSATMENGANAYSASSCEIQGDGSYGGDDTDKGFYGTSQAWATTGYSAGVASKSQLRTHILSNGNVIWDISGNVWEWTDAYVNGTVEKPTPIADAWAEYTAITDYTALNYSRPQNPAWTSANGIGQYYAGTSAGQRGFIRGGNWNNGAVDGVFTLSLSNAPSTAAPSFGFRCSR